VKKTIKIAEIISISFISSLLLAVPNIGKGPIKMTPPYSTLDLTDKTDAKTIKNIPRKTKPIPIKIKYSRMFLI
jgi:hypothetical protein